ncbi:MAG: hypothetical protein U0103_06800 [Candidatus Obscuribacterales bacterium]
MTEELTRRHDKVSGIQSLLARRASMQWTHLKNLMNQGSNREAAAIVESFEIQMSQEQHMEQQVVDFTPQ